MGYSAKAVANYFLSKHRKSGITPLKIQKLVYIAHGWYMAFYEDPLIDNEFAEAWEYGPVFPSLYHEFKHRGKLAINALATDVKLDVSNSKLTKTTPRIEESNKQTRELLDRIWEVYGKLTGIQLSNMCHQPGSPWHNTRHDPERKNAINADIDDHEIREHYRKLLTVNRTRRQNKELKSRG